MWALILLFHLTLGWCSTVTIKCRLNIEPRNITHNTILRSNFDLYQVGNYSRDPYFGKARLKDLSGRFEFEVPAPVGGNATSYFQLSSSSQDYHLKPNRVLIEVRNSANGDEQTIRAFQNVFGREHFPSVDARFAEELPEIPMPEGYLEISYVKAAPLRAYIIARKHGILERGPLASILNSKYKLAAVITMICLLLFPTLVEKFDPEIAQAIKDQKLHSAKEKYGNAA